MKPLATAVLSIVLAMLLASLASPAQAAGDRIESLDVVYAIQADGTVRVTTTIDWNFGETGRHGIVWELLTREEWGGGGDQLVLTPVSDIKASSPTGAPTKLRVTQDEREWQRWVRVRVADMEVELDKSRHTYVIEYTQEGALRTFDGKPEFYWDVTGVNLPPIAKATVKVTAPGGITEAKCHPAAGTDCSVTTDADGATFSAEHVDGILTVYTGLVPGKVANAKPILKPMPDQRTWDEKLEGFVNEHRLPSFLATGLVSFLMFVWGPLKLLLPRRIKDERYVNAPPGVVVQGGATTRKRLRGSIPVRFIPPEETLVQAGRALNRRFTGSALAATIVQAAVEGAVTLSAKPRSVRKKEEGAAASDGTRTIYRYADPADSTKRTTRNAYREMARSLDSRRTLLLLDSEVPKVKHGPRSALQMAGLSALLAGLCVWLGAPLIWVMLVGALCLGALLAALVGWRIRPRPFARRSAYGTAIYEQTEGFRQYIATAEAHQLDFDADRDIYTRYLPWAVLFGLTDRWTKFCRQLARQGVIDEPDVSFFLDGGSVDDLNDTVRGIESSSYESSRMSYDESSPSTDTGSDSASSSGSSGGSGGGGGGVGGGSV